MENIKDVITAIAFCVAVMAVIWAVGGKLLTPCRCRAKMYTLIDLRGGADDTEHLCRWLRRLRQDGADMEILLLSDGLSEEEARLAEMLTRRGDGQMVTRHDLAQRIGDRTWQEKTIT